MVGLDALPVERDLPGCGGRLEGEDRLDLRQRHGDPAQRGDQARLLQLRDLIGAIAGVGVDRRRHEQAEFVVKAQRLV